MYGVCQELRGWTAAEAKGDPCPGNGCLVGGENQVKLKTKINHQKWASRVLQMIVTLIAMQESCLEVVGQNLPHYATGGGVRVGEDGRFQTKLI